MYVNMCISISVRERVSVCVCVSERERRRETSSCVLCKERKREGERTYTPEQKCVCQWFHRETQSVCSSESYTV